MAVKADLHKRVCVCVSVLCVCECVYVSCVSVCVSRVSRASREAAEEKQKRRARAVSLIYGDVSL